MGDQIDIISEPVPGATSDVRQFVASIKGISCAGVGETEAQAIRSLARILGDFVIGHAETIDKQRAKLAALGVVETEGAPAVG